MVLKKLGESVATLLVNGTQEHQNTQSQDTTYDIDADPVVTINTATEVLTLSEDVFVGGTLTGYKTAIGPFDGDDPVGSFSNGNVDIRCRYGPSDATLGLRLEGTNSNWDTWYSYSSVPHMEVSHEGGGDHNHGTDGSLLMDVRMSTKSTYTASVVVNGVVQS